jgi:cysteine-rich repeat protein
VSLFCGDGIRDPVTEECDDGNADDAGDACTSVCEVLDVPVVPLANADPQGGRRLGDSRHPAAAADAGFAIAVTEGNASPKLFLASFDPAGVPGPIIGPLAGGASATPDSPAVAALPGGKYAVVWTDPDIDGDGLGIGMQLVDPATASADPPLAANAAKSFSQHDPDMIWTGSSLVVAWVDETSFATAPDLKLRMFGADLAPMSGDVTLAGSIETEAQVALAPFSGSWAAAWRASAPGGLETIEITAGGVDWSIGPHSPGPFDDRPAVAALDDDHLLVVFTETDDATGQPVLGAAVLDVASPGPVLAQPIAPTIPALITEGQTHPTAMAVGPHVYVAWRSDGPLGDPSAEDLWLKHIQWPAPDVATALATPEMQLPRRSEHMPGDQRRPALAASPLWPEGALVLAWEDWGGVLGPDEASPDVLLELAPTPIVRLGGSP